MAFKPMTMNEFIDTAPPLRPLLNVSPIFDVITGNWENGENGSKILNGGIMPFIAFIGEGNTFKSTIMNSVMVRVLARHPAMTLSTYETEGSFSISRMVQLASPYPDLAKEDFYTNESRYSLTTSTDMDGEDWFNGVKKFAQMKLKEKSQIGTTPFIDASNHDGKTLLTMPYPTGICLDSMSEFRTGASREKMDKNKIDDKEVNDYFMRAGLEKSRMITEIPQFVGRAGIFLATTAHVDDTINMTNKPERKKLTYMRQGQDIKRVPKNFSFLTNHCWEIIKSAPYYNSDRTGPYYPSKEHGSTDGKTDLMQVTFHGLRNKSGLSGIPMQLIVSQSQGVLWNLSHYDIIASREGLGVTRKGHSATVDFYPDKVLMRTTVRDILDEDEKLARAVELSCEIALMYMYKDSIDNKYRMTFEEIKQNVIDKGYDWDKVLDTRGYWLYIEEEKELNAKPYLSGFDLLRVATGEYKPTFLSK